MNNLFLTSSVHAVAHDIARRVNFTQGNKLVFIDTAAEIKRGDKQWLANDRQALVDTRFDVVDYTITGKTQELLKKDLQVFDYIYLSGGGAFYLLQQSQQTGFTQIVRELINEQGKTYISTSAGSIITGPRLPNYLLDLEDRNEVAQVKNEAYNFVNFTIAPHWGRADFHDKYLKGRLEKAYTEDQVPLILLTDTQYIHIQDNRMEIIDVR